MAKHWLVSTVQLIGRKLLPGTVIDADVEPMTFQQAKAAGGLMVESPDDAVSEASILADHEMRRGASEAALESIMRNGLAASQSRGSGAITFFGKGTVPLRFDSVVLSGRKLKDMTAEQVATLVDGLTVVYVATLRDYFVWDATCTYADDSATSLTVINPTGNGANAGRFLRLFVASPIWMRQLAWTISPATGNNENLGTPASPLKDDVERQFRMGPDPFWLIGPYHIRVLGDVDSVVINGQPHPSNGVATTARVVVHGGLTTGVSPKAPLYSASDIVPVASTTADMTKPPYLVTSASLPVGWTESGLVNKRVRRTTDGAKFWVMKDVAGGTKQARCTETMQGAQLDVEPFTIPFSTSPALSNNDPIVVEDLVQVRIFRVAAKPNANLLSVVVENLKLGRRDSSTGSTGFSGATVSFDGCEIWEPAQSTPYGGLAIVTCTGCFVTSVSATSVTWPLTVSTSILAGGCNKRFDWQGQTAASSNTSNIRNKFYLQGAHFFVVNRSRFCILSAAIFDPPLGTGVQVVDASLVVLGAGAGWQIYGAGISWVLFVNTHGKISSDTPTPNSCSGSISDVALMGQTTIRPYDPAAGAYIAAQPMTFAKFALSLAAGGFNGKMHDPETGACFALG